MARAASAQSPPAAPDTIAIGDWQLAPTLELRTRGEWRHDPVEMGGVDQTGAIGPRVRDAWFLFERTRVGIGAERQALRAQVTLQDTHGYGTPSGAGVFAPHEAFVEVRSSQARPSFVRLGRQAVQWGDGRLLGTAEFDPVARSLDALRAHWALGGAFDLEALGAILTAPEPQSPAFGSSFGPESTGVQIYGGQLGWGVDPLLHVELLSLARVARVGGGGTRFDAARNLGETFVLGGRVAGEGRGFKYGVEGDYELGAVTALSTSRAAWAAAAYVARTFDTVVLTPTVRIGGSYASGDDGHGKYKQFDPLLPDTQLHGQMDLFAWSNHVDVDARVTVVPFTDTQLGVSYRYARLAQKDGEWLDAELGVVGRAPDNPGGSELGHELDAFLAWQPWSPLDLRAGYSLLVLGDGARTVMAAEARGASSGSFPETFAPSALSHFTYLQATLSVP